MNVVGELDDAGVVGASAERLLAVLEQVAAGTATETPQDHAAATYAATAAREILGPDNPELATLFRVGGVAHPSGYPLAVLYLRAMRWLPSASSHISACTRGSRLSSVLMRVTIRRACSSSTFAAKIACRSESASADRVSVSAVRIAGRDQVHVTSAQQQVTGVLDPPLAAGHEHDHRVRMDDGRCPLAAVLVIAVGIESAVVLHRNADAGTNPVTIKVYAQQFAWQFTYAGDVPIPSAFIPFVRW